MTTKSNIPSRRFSKEQQQERLSRSQFQERLDEMGWIHGSVEPDMGEDLLVRIYDGGQSTGLSFFVQLKSTADSNELMRKKTATLAYKIDVKDLLHWEVSTTLVVLVVWDVKKRTGWWSPIPELIRELDKEKKGWRRKGKVRTSIRIKNDTGDFGMTALRWRVADHNILLVPKPRPMNFSLRFDKTAEGVGALRALRQAWDAGDNIVFEKGYIPKIEYPAWFARLYGKERGAHVVKVEIEPTPTAKSKVVSVEIDSSEGPAMFPYIELRPIRQGRTQLVLSNEHQSTPLVFTVDLNEEDPRFSFRQVRLGTTVHEAREAAAFMLAIGAAESTIRIIDPKSGRQLSRFERRQATINYDVAEMRLRRDLFDKLCFIQQQISRLGIGPFLLADRKEIADEEIALIQQIFEICCNGKRTAIDTIELNVKATEGDMPEGDGRVQLHFSGGSIKLFNVEIPLGNMTSTITDSARFLEVVRVAGAEAVRVGKPVHVVLENMHAIEEYHEWLPRRLPRDIMSGALERLSKAAAPYEGYFTGADARAAGASGAIFDALLQDHKIELCATDVLRLTHFPPSDREDLIIPWLQTSRQGVLSHETALFIHELSDVLPGRRHITVPCGWTPGDIHLDNNIDLHRANIDEDEIRWCGPVPYTAPLRTLRDCIEVGVSPDLIEQAIEEGLQRGLFRKDQIPSTVRAESA